MPSIYTKDIALRLQNEFDSVCITEESDTGMTLVSINPSYEAMEKFKQLGMVIEQYPDQEENVYQLILKDKSFFMISKTEMFLIAIELIMILLAYFYVDIDDVKRILNHALYSS